MARRVNHIGLPVVSWVVGLASLVSNASAGSGDLVRHACRVVRRDWTVFHCSAFNSRGLSGTGYHIRNDSRAVTQA